MSNITIKIILTFVLTFAFHYLIQESAFASNPELFNGSINTVEGSNNDEATNLITNIKNFTNIFAAIVLSISILMFVYGAFNYIVLGGGAFGNSKTGGRTVNESYLNKLLIYPGIGIIISLSAFAIARLFASFGF